MKTLKFQNEVQGQLYHHLAHNASLTVPSVVPGELSGKYPGACIVGMGPSLTKHSVISTLRKRARAGWYMIGCKEAIRLLHEHGIKPHAYVNIDPKPNQVGPKTPLMPVTYYLSSCVHPEVVGHLMSHGRDIRFFHSACGVRGPAGEVEAELYRALMPQCSFIAEGGHVILNRAVALADALGLSPLLVAGADFGWRRGSSYYARGAQGVAGNRGSELTDDGKIDGQAWLSKGDLMRSAAMFAWLLKHPRPGLRISVIGDSMAVGLSKHPDEFILSCMSLNLKESIDA